MENTIKEAVGIEAMRIYDSCRDKECLEDMRLFLTEDAQRLLDCASSVKAKCAEVIGVHMDVEEVAFNKGYYTVDICYYFRVKIEIYNKMNCPTTAEGLAVYHKRVMLFGSCTSTKIFTSSGPSSRSNGLPTASVEMVEPVLLDVKVEESCDHRHHNCCPSFPGSPYPFAADGTPVPQNFAADAAPYFAPPTGCSDLMLPDDILREFDSPLVCDATRKVFVSLGLFTVISMTRPVQVQIPVYDFYFPENDCECSASADSPCDLFAKLCFPVDNFYPPANRDACPAKSSSCS